MITPWSGCTRNPVRTSALVRDINIEDLLFRDSVVLDDPNTQAFYRNKRILVERRQIDRK